MQRAHNQAAKRQTTNTVSVPNIGSFSGDATASTVNFGTSLLIGTTGASSASVTNPLVPGQDTITLTTSSTSTETGATSSTSLSSSSSPSLSTGAVVGITVGVFVVVIGTMFAIYGNFKRRTASQTRRAIARGPPKVVRGAGGGSGSGREKQWKPKGGVDHGYSKERPISGATNITTGKIALFEKELSVRSLSDEKANVSDNNTFDPSAMPDFTKYHTALTDGPSNLPPPRPFVAREEGSPAVSWGSGTGSADPLLSLRASASGTMSPSSVTARQTPRTIGDSALHHHWESAEVLIMDDHATERPSVYSDVTKDPFLDNSVPRPSNSGSDSSSKVSGRNPFFSAGQHNPFSDRATRSRKSSVSTAKRSRSNSSGSTVRAGASEGALLSLIAALDKPSVTFDEHTIRTSLQTDTTSLHSPTESGVPMPAPKAF